MLTDIIVAVGIDASGSLWIRPQNAKFPYIYREASEVRWDAERDCLFSPGPRKWSYIDWFRHLVEGAREQGTMLILSPATSWHNIDDALREELETTF
jgi:hypothetical protein